jgi:hypothetical protein
VRGGLNALDFTFWRSGVLAFWRSGALTATEPVAPELEFRKHSA